MASTSVAFALIIATLSVGAASAQPQAPTQGGSLPLSDVLVVAKGYPNLVTQVRLRLVATGQKADKVVCTAQRLDNRWAGLSGARIAPYICPVGKRTLTVTATPTYYDKAGYKLKTSDPALAAKAVRVVESRLQWSWK